jgi:hypothetical protein
VSKDIDASALRRVTPAKDIDASALRRVTPAGVLTVMTETQRVRKAMGRLVRTMARYQGNLTDGQRQHAREDLAAIARMAQELHDGL